MFTKSFLAGAAITCMTAFPTQAGQPIKESLVECAVMVELLLGEQSFAPGGNDMLDLYTKAAATMRREAVKKSNEDYVSRTAATKRDLWHKRWDEGDWDNPDNRSDLLDWWGYCFKLADHLELKLEP